MAGPRRRGGRGARSGAPARGGAPTTAGTTPAGPAGDTAAALQSESVDLLGLAAEECAHYEDCTLAGDPVTIHGDARLLRRLIRNLLDNARRHGAPPVTVTR